MRQMLPVRARRTLGRSASGLAARAGRARRNGPGAPLFAVVAMVIALLGAPLAWGAPFDWTGRDWEGCSELIEIARTELGVSRVVVTTRLDLHALEPTDAVVMIHPERTLDVDGYARFLRAGGRLVLLDDYGTGDELLQHFGIERIPLPDHPANELRGNASLAIAEPASAHVVLSDVAHVVLNHATGLKHPDLSPVLQVPDESGHTTLVAVAGMVGQGRLVAVGDPSVVMNSMLRYGGNRALARNIVRYAGGDDASGQPAQATTPATRGRVYFVEGAFEQVGTFGEEQGWLAPWVRAVKDAVQSLRTDGMPPPLAFAVAVLIGLAIVMWTGSRAGRTHRTSMPRFTRPVPIVAQGGIAGHAAVVGGETASRFLAMLELKAALEEELCHALGLDENPGHEEILSMLKARKWGDDGTLAQLRALLLRMANVETMMLSSRSGATMQPVRDREVLGAARDVRRLVAVVREAARRRVADPEAAPASLTTPGLASLPAHNPPTEVPS